MLTRLGSQARQSRPQLFSDGGIDVRRWRDLSIGRSRTDMTGRDPSSSDRPHGAKTTT